MKKVCFYCRVNSPEQAEGTAERKAKQIERCRNVADLHNFTVVDEMRDFCGHSMEEVNRRRALNEMIAKARRGEFNSVVIPSLKVLSLDADVSDLLGFKVRNPKYPKVPKFTPNMGIFVCNTSWAARIKVPSPPREIIKSYFLS